ncbi:MAG TPA: HAD family hydrolase [Polyangiaceae bacterium]|nr:HAD family hydrolase [Polyangiaceae bacterium]
MASPVVLFDLDGTVLTFEGPPPGPGRTALDRAMRDLYAREDASRGIRFAGGTDRGLVRALIERHDRADDAAIERVIASYLEHLDAVLKTRRYRPVGDVAACVASLRGRGAGVGVATGNVRAGARLKLASAGLASTFDLAMGGFGCDAELRAEIVQTAVDRCRTGMRKDGKDGAAAPIVVVGDTEHDVRAARAVGARVVGVAMSEAAHEELLAAGADAIVRTCGDELVNAVLG